LLHHDAVLARHPNVTDGAFDAGAAAGTLLMPTCAAQRRLAGRITRRLPTEVLASRPKREQEE
jgi:hypothetical protein